MLRAEGTDFVFLPREEDLYSDGYRYRVTETRALARRSKAPTGRAISTAC